VAARNILALKREFDERDVLVLACMHISPDSVAELAAASIYAKAFLETLGKRQAVSVDDLVRTRLRRKGKKTEVKIGLDGMRQRRSLSRQTRPTRPGLRSSTST
jgi:hypothetical protein